MKKPPKKARKKVGAQRIAKARQDREKPINRLETSSTTKAVPARSRYRRNSIAVALVAILVLILIRVLDKDSVPLSLEYRLIKQDIQDAMEENDFKIAMVGDVMLGGTSQEILERYGYEHAFKQTRKLLNRSEIAFGNLEGPLTDQGDFDPEKTYSFRSKPREAASALVYGGFDIVSLANNHTMDFGSEGLVQTIDTIRTHGITYVGAGMNEREAREFRILTTHGRRIAFLAYSLTLPETFWAGETSPGTAFGKIEHIEEDVAAAKRVSDVVVVSMHWGQESTTELKPYQKFVGRAIIDAGATIVIGHHPHILQAVEQYKDGVILYSLGNFAFGSYSKKVDNSVIAQAYFKDNRLTKILFWPIYVRNSDVLFQSKLLHNARAVDAILHLRTLSLERETEIVLNEGRGVLRLDSHPISTRQYVEKASSG